MYLSVLCLGLSPAIAAQFKVLDFWGVGGFAHGSRPSANVLLDSLCKVKNCQLDLADKATVFTSANLAQYTVVVINNSTEIGKLLNVDQKAALLDFMKSKGYLGFHGAGDTKGSFADYTILLGGELSSHGGGNATLLVDTMDTYVKTSTIAAGLPLKYVLGGEWYAYKTNPRLAPNVKVLYTMDEASCTGCVKMGPLASNDHPVAWVREEKTTGGRMFYMAMGHENSVFEKDKFSKQMVSQALTWAARLEGPSAIRQSAFSSNQNAVVKSQNAVLTVETQATGPQTVEILTLQGKRMGFRKGQTNQTYTFNNLNPNTVYSVVVNSKNGKESHLITTH